MSYRTVQILSTGLLFFFSLLCHSKPLLPEQCQSLSFNGSNNPLRDACIKFYEDKTFKDYTAHVIYQSDDFAEEVEKVLKDKANSSAVFFLVDPLYTQTKPLLIESANVAFIGVKNLYHSDTYIVLQPFVLDGSRKNTGTALRYNNPVGELIFDSIVFTDDYYHNSDHTEEPDTLFSSLVDIQSAKTVKANYLDIASSHHKQALSFNCAGNHSETDIALVNSTIVIPAKNAYGVSFECPKKEHFFKVQYAFTNIYLNISELLLQKYRLTYPVSTNSSLTNSTALPLTATTNKPVIPENDIGIFIDVAGKIEFQDSVCNKMLHVTYSDWTLVDTQPAVEEQVLYVTRKDTFYGSLSTTISATKIGNNYTPEQEVFEMAYFCPNQFDSNTKKNLHHYQPETDADTQFPATLSYLQDLYALNDNLQNDIDYYKATTTGLAITAAVETLALAGIAWKFRKTIFPLLRTLRPGSTGNDLQLLKHEKSNDEFGP